MRMKKNLYSFCIYALDLYVYRKSRSRYRLFRG